MKKITIIALAVLGSLTGCSLDSVPKEELCPGPGMDADNIVVYIYQNGVKEEDILHSERCPEYAPVCRQFTYGSENSGKFFCMEDCAKQYCENKDCPNGTHKMECNGHCILPNEDCKDEEEPTKCIENCIDKQTRMVCSSDQTTYKKEICASDEECHEGECIKIDEHEKPVCTAGEVKCSADGVGILTCNEEGQWNEPELCPGGQKCDLEQKKCIPYIDEQPECENGAIKCADETSYYVCVNGHWNTEKTSCGDGRYCDGTEQVCKEGCIDKTIRCSDDKTAIQKCAGGVWETSYTCTDGKLCIDNECREHACTPGGTFCDDSLNPPEIYTCNDNGQKGEKIDVCKNKCNDAHTGCWTCAEETFQCTEKGTIQVCEGGAWRSLTECGAGKCDDKTSKTPGCNCTAGGSDSKAEMRCSPDASAIEVCAQLEYNDIKYRGWKVQTSCGSDMCITTGGNGAACKCKENEYQCRENTLWQCQDGILTSVKTCSDAESCNAEKKDCVCKDGARRCNHNDVEKCVSGEWKIEKSCSSNQYCNDSVGSVCVGNAVCVNGETECTVTNLMRCFQGLFEIEKECFCIGGGCYNNAQMNDLCQKTPNYQWCFGSVGYSNCNFTPEFCGNIGTNLHCINGLCIPLACSEYSKGCSGSTLQVCHGGAFVDLVDCSDYGMECGKNEKGEALCVPK